MIRPTMSHAVNKDGFHELMSDYATHLEQQLAKANEAASFYKEQYEKVDRECTKLAMREAKANEQLQSVCNHNATQQPEITRLRAELAKANERIEQLRKEQNQC